MKTKVDPITFEIETIDTFYNKYGITVKDLIDNIEDGAFLPFNWLWEQAVTFPIK